MKTMRLKEVVAVLTLYHSCGCAAFQVSLNGHRGVIRSSSRSRSSTLSSGTALQQGAQAGDAVDSDVTLAGYALGDGKNGALRIATGAIDALFKFEPFFEYSCAKAREKIIERADSLGCGWQGRVDGMMRKMDTLNGIYDGVLDPKVWTDTPKYYKAPFHAYKEGNLSWLAAMEVDPSAVSVHSRVFAEDGELQLDGDDRLRANYHQRMLEMLRFSPKKVVDVGCSTGISTLKLAQTFPTAEVTGVDLSPHMLSIAQYKLKNGEEEEGIRKDGRVTYLHAAGEATSLPDSSVDLVSICLVMHELPAQAAQDMLKEAARVLRPGGAIAFMDMNPHAPRFKALAGNPFAFAGFKSSEPYLLEYISLDLAAELKAAGFIDVDVKANSPYHRTCVGYTDK